MHASAKLFARTRRKLHYVYSLFRATRVSPESPIDPAQQLAFYVTASALRPPAVPHGGSAPRVSNRAMAAASPKKSSIAMGAILGVWHPGDRIYHGWFTEGFDTRDLKEAKALLEELAA